jgi:hypothetical protein
MGGLPAYSQDWDQMTFPPAVDYFKSVTAEQFKKYQAIIAPMDAVHFIGRSKAEFLFQFATYDVYISKEAAEKYFQVAPSKKEIRWYTCSHDFNDPKALTDRLSWLAKQLGLNLKQ